MQEVTLPDFTRILKAAGGENDEGTLDGDILDVPFPDLGYDSLALLETVSRISREYGVALPDDMVQDLPTPRSVLEQVNARLRTRA